MLEISRFYGIVIKMYYLSNEHNPPHIHAIYNNKIAVIDIQTLDVIERRFASKSFKTCKRVAHNT